MNMSKSFIIMLIFDDNLIISLKPCLYVEERKRDDFTSLSLVRQYDQRKWVELQESEDVG